MEGYNIYFYDEKKDRYLFYCRDKSMDLESLISVYKNSEHSGYISNLKGEILSRF